MKYFGGSSDRTWSEKVSCNSLTFLEPVSRLKRGVELAMMRQKMATDRHPATIIGRVGLLGASAGIVLGLIEAACLRLTDLPLPLLKPHVPPSFWFFAPLLTSVVFGLLGLLAGSLAALPRSRFLGMVIIAGFAGLTGAYLAFVLRYSQSASVWYIALAGCHHARHLVCTWFSPGLWPLCGLPGSLTRLWASWPMCRSAFGLGVSLPPSPCWRSPWEFPVFPITVRPPPPAPRVKGNRLTSS